MSLLSGRRVSDRVLTPAEVSRVRGVLFLAGLRGDELDDAVQDVHLRVLERAPSDVTALGSWACAVAANLATDRFRRRARGRDVAERLAAVPPSSVDRDLALKQAVAGGLSRLDADLRAVLILRFYADLPVGEIARHLQVPEGTVKSRLHRAVTALRRELPRESVMDA